MRFSIKVSKESARTLTRDRWMSELSQIGSRPIGDTRKNRGWTFTTTERTETPDGKSFGAIIVFTCKPRRKRTHQSMAEEFDKIKDLAVRKAIRLNWMVLEVNGEKFTQVSEIAPVQPVQVVTPPAQVFAEVKIPEDWKRHFSHIYERDDQIEIIMSAIGAAVESDWRDRYHCALLGEPAGGKTEVVRAFRSVFGDQAVLEFDATSTTHAAAIRTLSEMNPAPRILIIEEIEKASEEAQLYLLGILDHRAEINKRNFRTNIHKKLPVLGLATVNDYRKFGQMMSGALASRFPNKIFVPRPNRELLKKILIRDVAAINGDPAWIEPALDFASKHEITDPRRVIAICKCGRNKLLTGEYQIVLERTNPKSYIQSV